MHLLIPLVTCGKQCFIVGFLVKVHVFCSICFGQFDGQSTVVMVCYSLATFFEFGDLGH
jgi:hypothetical protein